MAAYICMSLMCLPSIPSPFRSAITIDYSLLRSTNEKVCRVLAFKLARVATSSPSLSLPFLAVLLVVILQTSLVFLTWWLRFTRCYLMEDSFLSIYEVFLIGFLVIVGGGSSRSSWSVVAVLQATAVAGSNQGFLQCVFYFGLKTIFWVLRLLWKSILCLCGYCIWTCYVIMLCFGKEERSNNDSV